MKEFTINEYGRFVVIDHDNHSMQFFPNIDNPDEWDWIENRIKELRELKSIKATPNE